MRVRRPLRSTPVGLANSALARSDWVPATTAGSSERTTLRAMAARDFRRGQAAAQSKSLLRQLIRYHLNGQPLNTRRILQDLRALETVDPA